MRFENPIALFLLLLIPLVFFLRRQRTRSQLRVANLYLWRESTARDMNTLARRIRRDWLQILQATLLAVIAFGVARPTMSDDGRSTAFIFDTSMSMGTREGADTRLDRAKTRAIEMLEQLRGNARLQIVSSDGQSPIAGPFAPSDRAAREAIRSMRVTDGHGDLPTAIERVQQSRFAADRLYVFSDVDAVRLPSRPGLEWVNVGQRANNAAIRAFSARPSIGLPGQVQILLAVSNYGRVPVDGIVRLTRERSEVARQRVSLLPYATESYSIDLPATPGVLEARLDHNDALAADNVRWLVVPEPARIRVQLPSSAGFFLTQAIAAHPEIVSVAPNTDADVIVCDRCSSLPDGTAGVLRLASASEESAAATLATFDADHPVADGLEIDGASALVHKTVGTTPGVVVVRGDGEPAVVAQETETRRVVDVRLDVERGAFPLSPAFPVLISNAVRWLAARDVNPRAVIAGEPLQWHIGDQRTHTILSPDGHTLSSTFADGILSFTATNAAGIYRVVSGAEEARFVVNPAVDGESNVDDSLPPSSFNIPVPAPGGGEHRNLTAMLLFVALLLLALEWRHQLRASA